MGYSIRNLECPRCGSHSRHRALFLWLRDQYQIAGKSGRALIFAPERSLAPLWESAKGLRTFKIDIEQARNVDVLADIMNLPFDDEVADLIWCHHVLEQVMDDHRAMSELLRLLKPKTGQLILSAGMSGLSGTREFGRSDKGLSGNRRSYGTDIAARLTQTGFTVRQLEYGLTEHLMAKYAIANDPFYVCIKD